MLIIGQGAGRESRPDPGGRPEPLPGSSTGGSLTLLRRLLTLLRRVLLSLLRLPGL